MLDTKTSKMPKTNKLALIDIDYDHFVDNNLPTLVTYLKKEYLPSWRETHDTNTPPRFVKDYLAINTAGNLALTDSEDDEPLYGFNQNINIAKRNLSLNDWAKKILEHYVIWFNKQHAKQLSLSPAKIAEIANGYSTTTPQLFTPVAYDNWLLANLDHFSEKEISLRLADFDPLFVKKLLVTLNSIKQIKSSLVRYLIVDLSYNYQDFDYTIICEIFRKLYQIILDKNCQVKLIMDEQLSLPQLVLSSRKIRTTPKKLVAPVSNLNDVAKVHLTVLKAVGTEINFEITSKDDLYQFLRTLNKEIAKNRQIDTLDAFDQLTTHRIKLGKYQATLQAYLDATKLVFGENEYIVRETSNICKAIFE